MHLVSLMIVSNTLIINFVVCNWHRGRRLVIGHPHLHIPKCISVGGYVHLFTPSLLLFSLEPLVLLPLIVWLIYQGRNDVPSTIAVGQVIVGTRPKRVLNISFLILHRLDCLQIVCFLRVIVVCNVSHVEFVLVLFVAEHVGLFELPAIAVRGEAELENRAEFLEQQICGYLLIEGHFDIEGDQKRPNDVDEHDVDDWELVNCLLNARRLGFGSSD